MDGMPRRRLIELPPNRIWQIWVLDALAGVAASEDSHFREDWIASVTRAVNPGSTNETEKLNWGQSNRKNSTAEVDAYNDPKNRLLNRACGSFFYCSAPTFHDSDTTPLPLTAGKAVEECARKDDAPG